MNRRSFMIRTGAMLGTGALASVVSSPLISASPPPTEPPLSSWEGVRSQFNLAPNKINMSCYWHASHPKPVRDAIELHRRGLDECPSEYFEENASRLEAAVRTAAAEYLAGKPDDFAMTGSRFSLVASTKPSLSSTLRAARFPTPFRTSLESCGRSRFLRMGNRPPLCIAPPNVSKTSIRLHCGILPREPRVPIFRIRGSP